MIGTDKKIGLALSGGGVIGFAHIGILKELVENKIKIDAICGSSAGAIIGLLYSIGGIAKIESFLAYLDGAGVFRKKLVFPQDLFKTLRTALEKYLGATDFNECKIPFSCIASDLETGLMVELDKGNVIDAVMASSSYPGVFPPQVIDGKYLVDGGITKNLPVSVLKDKGMDFVIGSSLHNMKKLDKSNFGNILGVDTLKVMARSLDIMQAKLSEKDVSDCDYCFTPPVGDFQWFHFTKMEEIKKIGEEYAQANIGKLLKKLI